MLETINRNAKNPRCGAASILFALITTVALLFAPANASATPHSWQKGSEENQRQTAGMTSGVFGIVEGQTARLVVFNKGDKDLLVRLQFVNADSKVLIQCNLIVGAGKTVGENFAHPGGAYRLEMRAEFIADGTSNYGIIGVLVPSVQVIENSTGKTTLFADRSGFAEFRALPNPPLVAPDI